jgi:hypothetical protein
VASRLGHFLISESFMLSGLHFIASILPSAGSHHWPIQLEMDLHIFPQNNPFRFKILWLYHPSFQDNIRLWWEKVDIATSSPMYKFLQKLRHIKSCIKKWNKEEFENIFKDKKNVKFQMEHI